MSLLDDLAERHIQRAIDAGELSNLPGSGRPLDLDDDSQVPAHLRAGYRLLKNAHYLPPELGLRREIRDEEDLVRQSQQDAPEYRRACARLALLRARLSLYNGDRVDPGAIEGYRDSVLKHFRGS